VANINTPLRDIMSMMMILIPADYKTEGVVDQDIAKLAVIQFSIATDRSITFADETEVDENGLDQTVTYASCIFSYQEQYLIALLCYKIYLLRLKDEFNRGAINFKTITFEVRSLEERAKQVEYTLQTVEKDIIAAYSSIISNQGLNPLSSIVVEQFGSDWNG